MKKTSLFSLKPQEMMCPSGDLVKWSPVWMLMRLSPPVTTTPSTWPRSPTLDTLFDHQNSMCVGVEIKYDQWEFQDPKMEVLNHIRPYFEGISPYIALT